MLDFQALGDQFAGIGASYSTLHVKRGCVGASSDHFAMWEIGVAALVYSEHSPFPRRPTPADVEAILGDNGWSYTDRGDFKLLAGNMIDENWELALGGKPTKLHRDGIEK